MFFQVCYLLSMRHVLSGLLPFECVSCSFRSDKDAHCVYSQRGGESDHKTQMFVSNLERFLDDDGYNLGQVRLNKMQNMFVTGI